MSGNTAALTMSQAIPLRRANPAAEPRLGWRDRLAQLDLVPDLGNNIGSGEWWRGLATLTLLCGTAIATFPRSEEQTSELQSLMRISYAVLCLNKKNKIQTKLLQNTTDLTIIDT